MDPGSILAITSLSFQVFGGCVRGFTLLSRAHNLGKDASLLQTMLSLEEYRFVQWAREVGLISGDDDTTSTDTHAETDENTNTTDSSNNAQLDDNDTSTSMNYNAETSTKVDDPNDGINTTTTTITTITPILTTDKDGVPKEPRSVSGSLPLNPRLNQALASEIMAQLERLLTTDQLRKRYKLVLSETPRPGSTDDESPTTTTSNTNKKHKTTTPTLLPTSTTTPISSGNDNSANVVLQKLVSDRLRTRILSRANLIQSESNLTKRLWWAAVDRKKFEEMVKTCAC